MTKDSQGTPVRVGQHVAYSRSGYVVPGTVLEVRDQVRTSAWHVKDDIRIKAHDGSISRVRNGMAVLVLR